MTVKPARVARVAVALLLTTGCGAGAIAPSNEYSSGTWSIVAVDVAAAEVGVALATCVPENSKMSATAGGSGDDAGRMIYHVYIDSSLGDIELARLLPGHGAIAAQAQGDPQNTERIDRVANRLLAGASPQDAIAAASSGDSSPETRQYGVATLAHGAANFTGSENLDWAGAVSGPSISAQGNILVGPAVVSAALEAFEAVMKQPDAVLADGLLAALEAGAREGGDKRCPREQTALTAFVAVARTSEQGDSLSRWLTVPAQRAGEQNPVTLLREAYDRGDSSPVEVNGMRSGWNTALLGLPALALILAVAVVVFWFGKKRGWGRSP